MDTSSEYYRNTLRLELQRRRRKNHRYSLRAFAKSLRIDAAALSRVLAGKRALSLKSAEKVAGHLGCTPQSKRAFLTSVARDLESRQLERHAPTPESPRLGVEPIGEEAFQAIAAWQHFAILELTFTRGFNDDPAWIAAKLGINTEVATTALRRLERLGLLVPTKEGLRKSVSRLHAKSAKLSTPALRAHQGQILDMARASVDATAVDQRAITTLMLPADPTKLAQARQMIEDFAWAMCRHMTAGCMRDVYALTVTLFPVSEQGGV